MTNCRFSPLQGGAKVACQTPDSSHRSVRLRLCQSDSNIDTRGVCDPNHNSHSRCRRGFNVNARYPGHSSGWYYSLAVSNINALSNSDADAYSDPITHSHEHARADIDTRTHAYAYTSPNTDSNTCVYSDFYAYSHCPAGTDSDADTRLRRRAVPRRRRSRAVHNRVHKPGESRRRQVSAFP